MLDVEFVNDDWYILKANTEGYRTTKSNKLPLKEYGVGNWPDNHPRNPRNLVLATASSFGDFLLGQNTMAGRPTEQQNTEARDNQKKEENSDGNGGGLRGKAPEVFNGDRTKSKAFISDLRIYFQINRNKAEIKNTFSRVLLALSFIKGANVVNWVDTQTDLVEEELANNGENEEDEDLWTDFLKRFKNTYVSTTQKEDAYVRMQKLQMKGDQLDEYIADHKTLVSELDWSHDSEMSCHSFREGLPKVLAKRIIENEGLPENYSRWIKYTQKYHSRWAMSKALGYYGKGGQDKPKWNPHKPKEKKERDPDAMDVDRAQMTPDEKDKLMRSGSCFRCKKQGHLAKQCPTKTTAQEATIEPTTEPKKEKGKKKSESHDDPPTYDSLLKQINACSMEDRQKILEVFSNDGDSEGEDF